MSTNILTSEERFVIYYDRLRDELNRAYTHYEICKALREFSCTHRSEFIEALTFFQLTISANLFATVMSISRFIDTRRDSLHLDVFFKFIKDNLNLFSTAGFKRRLLDKGMNTEDCEHWAQLHHEITAEMVDQDKAKMESLPIHNLKLWRNKKLAHIEKELALKKIDIIRENPITVQEIDNILITLHEILDRYRIAYDGVQWILGLPPAKPQIEYIMDTISFYRQSRKQSRNGLIKESKQK